MTTAIRSDIQIQVEPAPIDHSTPEQLAKIGKFNVITHNETTVHFRSKAIVLSNGASQNLHPEFFNWFPFLSMRKNDVILSDYFLQRKGFFETMDLIKRGNKKKIVIIGGSHSGFSSAWMLLNGPASVLKNSHEKPSCSYAYDRSGKFQFPDAVFKTISDC